MSDGLMTEGLAEERDERCIAIVEIGGEQIRCARPAGHDTDGSGERHKAVLPGQFGAPHLALVWGDA